ncbi:MAG: hypothetical protein EOO09_10950 [Chitinophagaceae bacterium]|nr:MAG: hypothetical protein EOO09_10950 [Chitinophagaceae bacterium]
MRIVPAIIVIVLFAACNRGEYIEIKTSLSDTKEDCSTVSGRFKMTSNFGGERFEFEKCLPEGFDASKITTARQGDTVVVKFNAGTNAGTKNTVVIDIDSSPSYTFITVDNDTYMVTATRD